MYVSVLNLLDTVKIKICERRSGCEVRQASKMDDSVKGGLNQFWELSNMIPYAPKNSKR